MAELSTMPSVPKLYGQAVAKGATAQVRGLLEGTPLAKVLGAPVARKPSGESPEGAILPTERFKVARHKIDQQKLVNFQRLMKDTLRDELPSVFLHAQAFPLGLHAMSQPEFPLSLIGMVHLSNEVDHRRPVRPDEELTVSSWMENPQAHFAGTQFDVISQINVGEETVWRGVSVYLCKGQYLMGKPERPGREEWDLEGLIATARWKYGTDIGREYAAVSGDFNPIHLSAISAKAAGMKSAMAHGMYSAARALAATAPHFEGYKWSMSFESPVFLPATVSFESHSSEDGTKTEFSGWNAKKQRRHFSGWVARR